MELQDILVDFYSHQPEHPNFLSTAKLSLTHVAALMWYHLDHIKHPLLSYHVHDEVLKLSAQYTDGLNQQDRNSAIITLNSFKLSQLRSIISFVDSETRENVKALFELLNGIQVPKGSSPIALADVSFCWMRNTVANTTKTINGNQNNTLTIFMFIVMRTIPVSTEEYNIHVNPSW